MKALLIVYLAAALIFGGCASAPKYSAMDYSLDESAKANAPTYDMKVAIAPFEDQRYAKSPDISEKELSLMIVKHFEHVKLFARQELVSDHFPIPSPENISSLKTNGYDAILIGSVDSFSWSKYRTNADPKATNKLLPLWILGFVMPLFWLLLIPGVLLTDKSKSIESEDTALSVKLIAIPSGVVLWEGTVSGHATTNNFSDVKCASLKISVTSLIEQLKSMDCKSKVEKQMMEKQISKKNNFPLN